MIVDYTRPSTWRKYHNGDCDGCHADCCRLPVEVHISEFVEMGLVFADELEHDLKNLIKRLKKDKVIRLYDHQTMIATLSTHSDGSCLFLDQNRLCKIYSNRPKTCRQFPSIGPRPTFCPKRKK